MQFTAIDSTLPYSSTGSDDVLHASRTLEHLTSLQTAGVKLSTETGYG
jgi:hypothetical protein